MELTCQYGGIGNMMSAALIVTTLAMGQVDPGLPRASFATPIPAVPTVVEPPSPPASRPYNTYPYSPYGIRPVGAQGSKADSDNGDKTKNDKDKEAKDNGKDKEKEDEKDKDKKNEKKRLDRPGFFYNFCKAYLDDFWPCSGDHPNTAVGPCMHCYEWDKDGCCHRCTNRQGDGNGNGNGDGNGENAEKKDAEPPRRALPSPWSSPPFPGSEYQGYPLIGVPYGDTVYPFMAGVYAMPTIGDCIKDTRIKFEGWCTIAPSYSTNTFTNTPAAYWIVPNRLELDQLVFRLQRETDTVQTDHIDWGFRAIALYGLDYRYTTAGGWGSEQLLRHNLLYGWDPVEEYVNFYIPFIGEGADIRIGRWIACPDIETQYSVDNYMASHSILFTYDTYTQTGVMYTQRINEQIEVQFVIHAGTDMAPWYPGAIATGAFGIRWVSKDNNDAFYGWLNAINNAQFRYFTQDGQQMGHDNFNYWVQTWEHRFSPEIVTKTESYIMWERNAYLGGTFSSGPVQPFGGGGGFNAADVIPGRSLAYGVLNYTMFQVSKLDYITVRNEWYRDETGFRTGFSGNYTSHTIGFSHFFNKDLLIRPEIGYYRNWTEAAFDNGTKKGMWLYGCDLTLRF
jgi:hypothetical protein